MGGAPPKPGRLLRAKAVLSSLSGVSSLRILLALAANSRPRARFFAHSILRIFAPGSRVFFECRIAGRKRIGFLRWENIDADLQSAMELAVGDCYRLSQLQQPDFIIDGGANTGLFSLAAAARWPNVPIIAFEPVPSNFETIKSHLEVNQIDHLVRVEQVALAGNDGNRRFFLRQANQGSLTADLPSSETVEVSCRGIAQYLPSDPDSLKLIKLDIEGSEVEVLDALFANGGISKTVIVMELHNTPFTRVWIEELVARIGFKIEFYENGPVTAHCQLTSPDLIQGTGCAQPWYSSYQCLDSALLS